jgi:hypothetical protein
MIRKVRSRPLEDIRRKIDTKPAGDNRKERSKAVEAAGNKDRAGSNPMGKPKPKPTKTPALAGVGASNVVPNPKAALMAAAAPMPLIQLPGSLAIDNLDPFAHVKHTSLNIASRLLWQ